MAIFGLGAGKMELKLNATSFHPKGILEGMAILTLNEDVKGTGVIARIWVQKRESTRNFSTGRNTTRTTNLYEDAKKLDSERTYRKSESGKNYNFSFTIPEGVLMNPTQGEGLINSVFNFMRNTGNSQIEWFVEAKLALPSAIDISKNQKIFVTLEPQNAIKN